MDEQRFSGGELWSIAAKALQQLVVVERASGCKEQIKQAMTTKAKKMKTAMTEQQLRESEFSY